MRLLTINCGSSSLKFALFEAVAEEERRLLAGQLAPIGPGEREATFRAAGVDGEELVERRLELPGHGEALDALLGWLAERGELDRLGAAGHRLVHGGSDNRGPRLADGDLVRELRGLVPLAPDHLPREIDALEAIGRRLPELPQVVCFDTAFHRDMPEVARTYPLPRELRRRGITRYGFHGLSYESIVEQLRRQAGPEAADGRLVVAHLGSGASMAAIRGGRSLDTTMGFTPAGGLVMSTRTGDLDPGVVLHLIRGLGMTPDEVNDLVNQRAGLLGVSGRSPDMRELLAREAADPDAARAVELFCYQATKHLAALAAVLGGLDTLVFTGGIGENAPAIRRRIVADLGCLGIRLDAARNDAGAPVVSPSGARLPVRVIRTDEEGMIARHTARALTARGVPGKVGNG